MRWGNTGNLESDHLFWTLIMDTLEMPQRFKQGIDRIGCAIYKDHSGFSCRKKVEKGRFMGRRPRAMVAIFVRIIVSQNWGIHSGNGWIQEILKR